MIIISEIMLKYLFVALLSNNIFLFNSASTDIPELCVVQRLTTRYVTATIENPVRIQSCWTDRHRKISGSIQAHAFSLSNTRTIIIELTTSRFDEDITLTEDDNFILPENVTLILGANQGALIKLTADREITSNITVLMPEKSQIDVDTRFLPHVISRYWSPKRWFSKFIHRNLQIVDTYTEISSANLIRISLNSQSSFSEVSCNDTMQSSPPHIRAFKENEPKIQGCFYDDFIHQSLEDVYVIELSSGSKNNPTEHSPVVEVVLERIGPIERSITLVLKANNQYLRWRISAVGEFDEIYLVSDHSENIIHNMFSNTRKGVFVRPLSLPRRLDALLITVVEHFEPPTLYVRTSGLVDRIKLLVGTDEMQLTPILLRERMEIICTRTQIRVTFPLWLHKAVGSPQVSLKDKSCAAVEQGSQLILEGQASACDSLLENDGRTTTIRNQVVLASDEHEEARLPVQCTYLPYIPGFASAASENYDEDDNDFFVSPREGFERIELYHLALFRDESLQESFDTEKDDKLSDDVDLYFQVWSDGVSKVKAVADSCWLSSKINPHQDEDIMSQSNWDAIVLIKNGCPLNTAIEMLSPPSPASMLFVIHLSRLNVEQIQNPHLFCKVGLCASQDLHFKGNMPKCVNFPEHCTTQTGSKDSIATAHQIVSKGPILLIKVNPTSPPQVKISEIFTSIKEMEEPPRSQIPIARPTGNAMEIVLMVGLGSFLVGVTLTVAVWFLHLRLEPFRRCRVKADSLTPPQGAVPLPVAGTASPITDRG